MIPFRRRSVYRTKVIGKLDLDRYKIGVSIERISIRLAVLFRY